MTTEVEAAVEEIREAFPDNRLEVEPEAQGGAYIVVHDLQIGSPYAPSTSWMGFLIPYQYPYADCYPHYIDGGVKRADGQGFGDAFSGPTPWQGRSAVQISRRSNRLNAATDTALLKLLKVLEWVRSR
jgi:hypothetical protein